jgi:hypothetical protein
MVDYGEHYADEAPTSTHIRRRERKYRWHKLAQAVGHANYMRSHKASRSENLK